MLKCSSKIITIIIICTFFAAHSGLASKKNPAKPVFVTSSEPLKWLFQQIAGENAEILALVTAGQEPDTFDPSPKDLRRLSSAKVYLTLGMPFEQAIQMRITEINKNLNFFDLRRLAVTRLLVNHSHDGVAHELEDPHYWTNPVNMQRFADGFRAELTKLMPDRAEAIAKNTEIVLENLKSLDRVIRADLKGLEGKEMWVFHPAWGYFCAEYGIKQVAIEAPNKERSPKELKSLLEKARRQGVKSLFTQPQFSRSNADFFAKQLGAELRIIDPMHGNYLDNMRSVAAVIKTSL